jgi:acyl-coenzyme A synthetase/AMP-(fatty) acid ligase
LHLFVVPAAGVRQADAGLATMLAEAVAELPTYQRPARIHIIAELPRTETGKLRRSALRA